jgi:broad specificity phosphatase PhoE
MVARGDLGSQPERLREIFDAETYPQYAESLSRLETNWWLHGRKDGFETRESFLQRAHDLRLWLASQASELRVEQREMHPEIPLSILPRILLVSHGGILSSCFRFDLDETPSQRAKGKMQNCELRVYDVCADGAFARPVGEDEGLVEGGAGAETQKGSTR